MQPDLPWNVAGIPPEAREAARAAARREGLSVGEWLTRKILRTMSEAAGGIESTTQAWRNAASSSADAYRTVAESAANATRDTEDMLARVSRSEDETHSAYNRIENHLKAVARRLDSAERSQSENNRAMSKAAAEINVAAREQAQAFDQLDSHVMALSERLSRLEQNASGNSGLKDAVKGLHNGLSRLADQIGETANQSATQISTLAENVETLASRLAQARHDADAAAKALKDHLLAVDERLRTVETQDGATEALTDMRTSLDGLSARMAEGEAQNAGAMARLEDNIAQLQQASEDKDAGPRLELIEQGLSELSARVDAPSVPETVSEELRQIGARLDAADQQHRREIAELHEALEGLEEASKPQSLPETPPESPQVFADEAAAEPPLPMNAVMNGALNRPGAAHGSGFDLPPFPAAASMHDDAPESGHESGHEATFEAPPFPADNEPQPFEAAIGYPDEHQFSGVQPFSTALGHEYGGAMGNGFTPGQQSAEDFIANTRRQARAAIETEPGEATMSGFAWSAGRTEEPEAKGGSRFGMIALAVLLIAGALAAGLYVFRGQTRGPLSLLHRSTPAATTRAAPIVPKPMAAQTPAQTGAQTQAQTQDDAAVAPPQHSPAVAAPQPSAHHKAAHTRTQMRKTEVSAAEPAPVRKAPIRNTQAAKTPAVKTAVHTATGPASQPATLSPLAQLTNQAKRGDVAAETVLGLKYLNGDGVGTNEAEAARWMERAAKQGQPVAEYRLGTLYERGHGVPANAALAVRWYERAATHGNRKAMHNLAVAYAQGAGVAKDFKRAALWFGRAAELGLRDSQFNLAVLYERGMGVRQNLGEAFKWYSIAARAGDSESKARVAALGPQMTPAARSAAERAASRFVPGQLDRAANDAPVLASR